MASNENELGYSSSFGRSRKNIQRKRSLNECYARSKMVVICGRNDEETSGVKRKRMDARSYRALFSPKQNKGIALDDSQKKDGHADCVVSQLSDSKPREPREKEGNSNCVRELDNNTGEKCLKRSDDGAGRLVSSSRSSVAIISKDVGEAELTSSRTGGSNSEGSSEPPGVKPHVSSNVVGEPLTYNTCFGPGVSPELEIVESDCVGASTGFNVLKKSSQLIDLKNPDPICDLVKKHRKVADNGVNPSPGDELAAGYGIRHANQSLPVTGGGTSSPSPTSRPNSHDNISLPQRIQDLSVERLISNEQRSIHIYQTEEIEKNCEILLLKNWEEKRLLLEKNRSLEATVIRQIYSQNVAVRLQQLKMLDTETSRKLEEHKKLIEAGLKDLKAKHLAGTIEERERAAQWLAKYSGPEDRTYDDVPIRNFPDAGHARNKVLNDLQSCDAHVSGLTVEAVGHSAKIESGCLQDELVNDLRTNDGSQSDATVYTMVDAVACDILSETVNVHSKDDNLLDACVDAAKEAEGCAVQMEIRSAPGIPTSEGIEVTVTDSSVLRDEELNEVARLSYSPENDHFVKHPKSDRETHEKLPSASNVVNRRYIQRTSSEERHDKLISGAPVLEDARKELRSTDDPDMNTTVVQSNGADDGEDRVIGSDTPDLLGNQREYANGTDPYLEQASLVAYPHEVIDSVDLISAPLRQANTDELPQCTISTEVQGEDQPNQEKVSLLVESIESENVVQLVTTHDLTVVAGTASSGVADNRLAAEPNYPTCSEQQQPSTEHVPLGPESGGSAYQIFNDGRTPLQATETTHQVEEPPNLSQHQHEVREILCESSSRDIRNPNIGNNRHSLPSISNQGGEPTSGICASFRCVGQPSVVDGDFAQRINHDFIHSANQLGLPNSHLSFQADPLQIELEKLRRGIEQTTKGHENLKSQLRSDCEKEIAEVIAEICCNYKAKVQDAEAIFQLKKKALDTNVNNVFVNKILADAVSTKWLDVRSSEFRGQQGFMYQLQQRSGQPTLEPANLGLSSAGTTPAAQQNTSLTLLAEPRSAALSGASCRPPIINSIFRPQINAQVGVDIRAAAPHLRSVGSNIHDGAPHLQVVGADIRAAAPHLPSFRPPMSVPAPNRSSLPHSVTTQQLSVNQPSLTLPSQVLPVQPRELISQQPSWIQPSEPSSQIRHTPTQVLPLSQTSSSPIIHSDSQRGALASHHTTHPSAPELLADLPNPAVTPVVPDSNVGPMGQSALHGVQGSLTSTIVPTDIVYLSDDE